MAKNIVGKTLLMVSKTDANDRGEHTELGVVQWFIDDEPKTVMLTKRRFWKDDDGAERFKPEGFRLVDLKAIQPKWKEIVAIMQNPPKVAPEPVADIEQAPF